MAQERSDGVFYWVRTLTKHSLVYGIFDFLGKAGAFVLIPVYTRMLPPSAYGTIELFLVTGTIVLIVVVMGFNSALTRYYTTERDERSQHLFFSTAFTAVLGTSIVALLGMLLAAPAVSDLVFDSPRYADHWRLVSITVMIDAMGAILLSLLRAQGLPTHYSMINLSKLLSTLVLNVVFVAIFRWGVAGVLAANCIGSFVGFVLGVSLRFREIRFQISVSHLRMLWKFGAPLVAGGFGLMFMNSADRYFVKAYTSLADLGTYALGYRIGMIMSLVINAFVVAWPPIMFRISKEAHSRATFSAIMTYYLLATCFILVAVGSFSKELVALLSAQEYGEASGIIVFILVSYLLQGMYYVLSTGVSITDNTKVIPFIVAAGAAVNLTGNIILIPEYGIWGAAVATVASYAVLPVGMLFTSQHYYRIPYDGRRIAMIVSVTTVLLLINLTFFGTVSIVNAVIKSLVIILFPTGLLLLGFFTVEERHRLKALLIKTRSILFQ